MYWEFNYSMIAKFNIEEPLLLSMRKYHRILSAFALILPIALCACGTAVITYQTPNIDQPILLGSKVGIPKLPMPSNATRIGEVDGNIGKTFVLIGMQENKEENADAAFTDLLPDAFASIDKGRYDLIVKNEEITRWFFPENPIKIDQTHDFKIDAILHKISGASDYIYGIKFGADSSGNGFIFGVTSNGDFRFASYYADDWHPLIDFKESKAIRQGTNVINKLTVLKYKNKYVFAVNESLVGNYEFQNFYGDNVGFSISSAQHVAVEKIIIRDLKNKKVLFEDDFNDNRNKWFITTTGERYVTDLYFGLRHRYLLLILGIGDHISFWGDVYEFNK